MPGHPELRELGHLATRKQIGQVRTNQAGDGDEVLLPRSLGHRQTHIARQDPRDLDDGNFVLATEGILARETDDEVQGFVGHLGKRVGRIQTHRHQQRLNIADEVILDPPPLCRTAIGMRHHPDALLLQQRHQLVVVDAVLL